MRNSKVRSMRFRLALGVTATVFALQCDPVRRVLAEQPAAASKGQLTDQDISAAVESEFIADRSVPHNEIEVATNGGVVTLTGTVSNLLARDSAQRLAQTVRGVRSVVNRLVVKPYAQRNDDQVKRDVQTALAYDPATDGYEIQVSAKDGIVSLNGKVESYAERELSEKVARGVAGVRDVSNGLVVQWKQSRPDAEIRADIQARLRWDEYVRHEQITANVNQGKVELSGKVGSDAERSRAYFDAWVMGVKSVDGSKLTVDPSLKAEASRDPNPMRSDAEIERAVTAALLYDPRVNSFKVKPSARGGVVTLHGTVDNLAAKQAAVQDARATTGVARVVDRVHVQPSTPTPDEDIAKNIRKAFERDPYVERYEMLVSVRDGTAYLSGTVDSYFEKMHADTVASRAKGVKTVRNNLTVYDDRSPLVYEPYVYDWYPYDYTWYSYAPANYRSDAEIRDEIQDELFWSPYVDASEVQVKVQNGAVTLSGTVDSQSEMHSALANAYEGGAVTVRNELKLN